MKISATIEPKQVTAIVDTREQHPLDLSPLRMIAGTLTTGDLIACVGRERERFDREVQRLLAFPTRALVVEASWGDIEVGNWRGRVTSAAAMGSLCGWIAHGLPVVMAGDHARAGRFVSRLLFIAARRRWREARNLLEVRS